MKPKLIVMVGIQGSGKSTQAKILAEQYKQTWGNTSGYECGFGGSAMTEMDAPIVSSDEIRKELDLWDNSLVFEEVYRRINKYLKNGANVIFDATSATLKSRQQIFERVKEPCMKIAYVMNVPYEECVKRVEERNNTDSHTVPLDVVEKYWKSFQCPAKFEGWDEVILHNMVDRDVIIEDVIIEKMFNFNQNNPNHSLSLGEHSFEVFSKLVETFYPGININSNTLWDEIDNNTKETINLIRGTYLHDVGKLFTRVPNKKDPSYDSYYSHAEVGAYFKICKGWTPEEVKYETYHMHPYQWKTEKSHSKWKKIFGEEFYNNLLILNKCDIEAH